MVTEHTTEKNRLIMISTMVSTNSHLGISYRLNISTSYKHANNKSIGYSQNSLMLIVYIWTTLFQFRKKFHYH